MCILLRVLRKHIRMRERLTTRCVAAGGAARSAHAGRLTGNALSSIRQPGSLCANRASSFGRAASASEAIAASSSMLLRSHRLRSSPRRLQLRLSLHQLLLLLLLLHLLLLPRALLQLRLRQLLLRASKDGRMLAIESSVGPVSAHPTVLLEPLSMLLERLRPLRRDRLRARRLMMPHRRAAQLFLGWRLPAEASASTRLMLRPLMQRLSALPSLAFPPATHRGAFIHPLRASFGWARSTSASDSSASCHRFSNGALP